VQEETSWGLAWKW